MNKLSLEFIDKLSLTLITIFGVVIGGLVIGGSTCGESCFFRSRPRVKEFSWQNQQLGAENTAFILTFDRPMDKTSVEKNLVIDPPLPGKISWAGRRLAYTLKTPIPYGENYQIHLRGAREKFREGSHLGQTIEPFLGEFTSRDRAFAYIGTEGEERGQLIFYNLTDKKKTVLTPPDLVVMDFEFYPDGNKILFSAGKKARGSFAIRELQLYTVETRINQGENDTILPKIELILDNKDYQNNKFQLSPDGKTIIVQRVNRQNPTDFDLWLIRPHSKPEKLNAPGGDFLITPDGQTVAVAQGQGIAILPIQANAEPREFLPKFGQVLAFSRDGSAAAMVNFNMDNARLLYTRSLFYVNNQGVQKELLNIEGSIMDCDFNHTGTYLYCLLTRVVKAKDYIESPNFARINLKTGKLTLLASLPDYRDIKVSLAPDNLGILFDQVVTSDNPIEPLTTASGEAIATGTIWLLIPPPEVNKENIQPVLKVLPMRGFHPQWMP